MAEEIKRSVTINRSEAELETAWHQFLQAQDWRAHLYSTQLVPQSPGRGTLLRVFVRQEADGLLAKAGQLVAKVRGEDLPGKVEGALRQFKALQEAGEIPSTDGQPADNRSVAERVKESMSPLLDKAGPTTAQASSEQKEQAA